MKNWTIVLLLILVVGFGALGLVTKRKAPPRPRPPTPPTATAVAPVGSATATVPNIVVTDPVTPPAPSGPLSITMTSTATNVEAKPLQITMIDNADPRALPPPAAAPVLSPSTYFGPEPLNSDSAEAVSRCFGTKAATWGDFSQELMNRAQKGSAVVRWSLDRVKDNDREYRVRLDQEVNQKGVLVPSLKIFSVDKDGLPNNVPLTPEQAKDPDAFRREFLKGKTPLDRISLDEFTLGDGTRLSVEHVPNRVIEAQVTANGHTLSCTTKGDSPRCQCP